MRYAPGCQGVDPASETGSSEQDAFDFAHKIVEALGQTDHDPVCSITSLLADKLLGIEFTENDYRLLADYLSTGDNAVLLPIATRSLEHIFPAGVEQYPLARHRMAANFCQSGLRPLVHLASSLLDELRVSDTQDNTALEKLAGLQLACADLLGGGKFSGQDLEAIIDTELVRNHDNLAALSLIAKRAGVPLDVERLMRIQPTVFEMLTSNDSITTGDVNYRKRLNAKPGAAHSLQAPELPDMDKLLSRYGDYIDFVEATAATRRGGYASTFGFLHRVGADGAGNPFIVEYPHTMFDDEILSIDHPVINKLKSFEQDFQRTHDMLHNALPVYAEHFMIHHPSAPITLGGYLPEYTAFGQGMRMDKSSYEIGLAILHKQIMQERFSQDPLLLANHVATVRDILAGLADAQLKGLCSDKAIDHVSFVIMSAAANILPIDSDAYQELAAAYEQLRLPQVTVYPRDVYRLLIQQEVVAIDAALRDGIAAHTTKDQMISQVCRRVDDTRAIEDLRNPNIDYTLGEQGAEYIVSALREMGIEPTGMNEPVTLHGRDRLRWIGITASSRRLKGLNEKIHGLDTVRFWDNDLGAFINVTPIELLGRFYRHFEQNADEYNRRVWFRGLSNATLSHFKDLAFNPAHSFHTLASLHYTDAHVIHASVDKCISSLLDDNYQPLDEAEKGRLLGLADTLHACGYGNTASRLQDCVHAYEVLVQEAKCFSIRTGNTIPDARKVLIQKLMTLDG